MAAAVNSWPKTWKGWGRGDRPRGRGNQIFQDLPFLPRSEFEERIFGAIGVGRKTCVLEDLRGRMSFERVEEKASSSLAVGRRNKA